MISEETWQLLVDCIQSGLTNKDSCRAVGVSEETFYKKMREDSEFSELVKKAGVKFKLKHISNISKASNTNWQASAWLLERKFKREFGKIEFTEEATSDLDGKDEEELNEMLEKLEKEDAQYESNKKKNRNPSKEEEA